jgi:hypothetical protein
VSEEDEGSNRRSADGYRRGAGETEDYMTPARPGKRAREESESPTRAGPAQKKGRFDSRSSSKSSTKEERRVRWDKGLIMISDSRSSPIESSSSAERVKSCLKKTVSSSLTDCETAGAHTDRDLLSVFLGCTGSLGQRSECQPRCTWYPAHSRRSAQDPIRRRDIQ